MSAPQAKTRVNELYDEIQQRAVDEREISEFDYRKLNKETEHLARVDAQSSWVLKSALCALRWDVVGLTENAKKADALGADAGNLYNLSVNFSIANNMQASAEYAIKSSQSAINDKNIADLCISQLLRYGFFKEALKVSTKCESIGISLPELSPKILSMNKFLDTNDVNLTQERIQQEIQLALEVLTKFKIRNEGIDISFEIDEEDGSVHAYTKIKFIGSIEEEMRMESELAQVLSHDKYWDPSLLNTAISYMHRDALPA